MFGPKLSQKAATSLDKLGVEQHMGSIVTHVDQGWVLVRDHAGEETRYDANTVLWTAGVEAPPIAAALAAATGAHTDRAGRIAVEKDLTIPGHPEISVLGDMMSLDKLPGVAEVAMQTGLYTGHRLRRRAGEIWPRSRSATTTSALRPTSPAAGPSSPPGRSRSAGSWAGSSGCSSTSRS